MEQQNDLFIQQNSNTPPEIPADQDLQHRTQVSNLAADPDLMKRLVRYVHSFPEMKDEIEIKGRLIDFIRNI